ncbi:hypothetical protein CLV24_1372 [Pontibacter ummariensis]|uniref:Uncharacterized protein n=1 Tax=Pontibacter ummariensis TaxID=1610492 RepID=A0A239L9B2_9BACT|nr:hypothetical protein CLV24_1372 [Pontibacter ummariensis]SNT26269.1 hypothetical protein SAMN06296052_1372 [Pontibacter ummariensis]
MKASSFEKFKAFPIELVLFCAKRELQYIQVLIVSIVAFALSAQQSIADKS